MFQTTLMRHWFLLRFSPTRIYFQRSLIENIIDLKNEVNVKAEKPLQLLSADSAVEEKYEASLSPRHAALAANHLEFGMRLTVQDYTADIEANKSMPVGLFNNKSRTQLDAGLTAQPSVRQKSRRPSFQSNEPTPNNASYFPEVNLAELNARPRGESQFELFREKKAESSSLPSHSGTYASLQSENSADMSSQDVVGASVIRIDFEGRGRSQSLKGSTNQSSNLIQRGRQFSVQKKATVLVKLGDSIAPVPTNQSLHSEFEHETSDAAKEASNPARSSVLAVLGRVKSTGKGAKLQTGNSFRKRNPIIGESILTTINQSTQSFDQAPLAPKKGVQAETLTPRENLQTGTLSPREDFQVEILTPREDVQAETLTPGEGVQAEKVIINETTHFESLDSLTANPSCSGSIAQLDEFIQAMKTATEFESRSATLSSKIIKLQQFNELPDSNVRDIRSLKVPQKSISRRVLHPSAISQPSIKSQRSVGTSLPRADENIRHNPQKIPRTPWLYDLFLFLFLIPAFDSRGQAITIDQFGADIPSLWFPS
ncbi:hypothetical protein BC830DRAFT_1080785 [Chytriomyces sp. MP71]|nr:hypothetical protein BC830DRAFT_1080785 [Chytriomyces sp. MP71]